MRHNAAGDFRLGSCFCLKEKSLLLLMLCVYCLCHFCCCSCSCYCVEDVAEGCCCCSCYCYASCLWLPWLFCSLSQLFHSRLCCCCRRCCGVVVIQIWLGCTPPRAVVVIGLVVLLLSCSAAPSAIPPSHVFDGCGYKASLYAIRPTDVKVSWRIV